MVLRSFFNLSSSLARFSVILVILTLVACSEKKDPPGVHIIGADNLIINRDGMPAVFSVVLTKAPSSDVTITVRTSDADEGRVSLIEEGPFTETVALLFKPNNWHVHQKLYIKAHSLAPNNSGNHTYKIILEPAVSQDPGYQGMDVADITITNVVDPAAIDVGSLLISSTTELITFERGGSPATFEISLSNKPTDIVTVRTLSSNPLEGIAEPKFTVFSSTNWNQPREIKILGVDDERIDGDQNYTIDFFVSSDGNDFNNIMVPAINAVNRDNESGSISIAGVLVTPTAGLITDENGLSDTFTVKLLSRPATGTSVIIAASINDTRLATINPTTITFDDSVTDWNSAKTFKLTGLDDTPPTTGDKSFTVALTSASLDAAYEGISISNVSVMNLDNDAAPVAGVIVSPTVNLITTEQIGGSPATFTVRLRTAPAVNETVTISASSDNLNEGTVSTGFTFTNANWQTMQSFTITGQDDNFADGDQPYTVTIAVASSLASASPYDGIVPPLVRVTNLDNEIATVSVVMTNTRLTTSENANADTFTVVLDVEPAADVTITARSSNTAEGTVAPSSLTFTRTGATIWNQPQTFTVTGVDDAIVDGNIDYNISLSSISPDTKSPYQALNIPPVPVTNIDNDGAGVAGVTLSRTQGLVTSENGATDSFTIQLNSQPSTGSTVVVRANINNPLLAGITPLDITFDDINWATAKPVTLTGLDDINNPQPPGDNSYTITFTGTSTDSAYNGVLQGRVTGINQDNDSTTKTLVISTATYDITASPDSSIGAVVLQAFGYYNSSSSPIGVSPGPQISLLSNQSIQLEISNDTSFDHNFEIPQAMPPVLPVLIPKNIFAPGISTSVNFAQAGIYRYGSADLGGRGSGFFGAIVVKPADGTMTAWTNGPTYQKERNWVISDFDSTWVNVVPADPATINTTVYNPTYFLINGKNGHAAMQDINTKIDGIVGDKVLIRILNAGQYDQSLHFHGNHFVQISEDGVNNTTLTDITILNAPRISTINIKRNSSAMILYTLKQLGRYPVHAHTVNMMSSNGVYLNGTATSITVCSVAVVPCTDL